jgi:hypothetical protein
MQTPVDDERGSHYEKHHKAVVCKLDATEQPCIQIGTPNSATVEAGKFHGQRMRGYRLIVSHPAVPKPLPLMFLFRPILQMTSGNRDTTRMFKIDTQPRVGYLLSTP